MLIIKPVNVAETSKIKSQGSLDLKIVNTFVCKYGFEVGIIAEILLISSLASSLMTSMASSTVTIPTILFSLSTTGMESKSYFESRFATSSLSVFVCANMKFSSIKSPILSSGSCKMISFAETMPSKTLLLSVT